MCFWFERITAQRSLSCLHNVFNPSQKISSGSPQPGHQLTDPDFFCLKKKEKFCVRLTDQGSANKKKPSPNDVSNWVLFVYTSNLLDKYIAYYMFYMAIKFVCLDCPDRPRDKLHNVLLHSIVRVLMKLILFNCVFCYPILLFAPVCQNESF